MNEVSVKSLVFICQVGTWCRHFPFWFEKIEKKLDETVLAVCYVLLFSDPSIKDLTSYPAERVEIFVFPKLSIVLLSKFS